MLKERFMDRVMDGYYQQHEQGRELLEIDLEEVVNLEVADILEEFDDTFSEMEEAVKELTKIYKEKMQ